MPASKEYFYGSADWSCFMCDFADEPSEDEPLSSLNYYSMECQIPATKDVAQVESRKIGEVYKKFIFRGARAYLQPEVEELLYELLPIKLRPQRDAEKEHSVSYLPPKETLIAYQGIRSIGNATKLADTKDYNPFDPDNPQNELSFYEQLIAVGGSRLAGYIHPQCPLDILLPKKAANSFKSQRLDFLVMFPNGKGVIFEPGDHGRDEKSRDANRDQVCLKELGIQTIRFENRLIGTSECKKLIKHALAQIDASKFLDNVSTDERTLLSPFAVHRFEAALQDVLFRRGLLRQGSLKIGLYCEEIPCAEAAAFSFFRRLENLSELFDEDTKTQEIDCVIYSESNPKLAHRCQEELAKLNRYKVRILREDAFFDTLDAFIDVSVTETNLKPLAAKQTSHYSYCLRNSFRHHARTSFRANSTGRPINKALLHKDTLNPFVRECFRLNQLRPDQLRVLEHLLASGDTIGLLPTGGGKSLCYQLAGLLTPGICLIIDPLVALMEDQVASLRKRYRIAHVKALHSAARINDERELFSLFEQKLFLFISPERFLRENFRKVLFGATQSGYRVGMAVIDEAHCVSMWGHDFRPAYLELAKNIRRFAKSEVGAPPILALSGTASQLVLIDLTRQLQIYGDNAVIRPKSFDRAELNYRVLPTAKKKKEERLRQTLKEVRRKVKSKDLLKEHFGIIFGTTRSDIFRAFSWIYGSEEVERLLCVEDEVDDAEEVISGGIYTGTAPKEVAVDSREWNSYKKFIFEQFVRGKVHCMIANNALSVGIDHPKIRYVINVSMPASLESYYQQAGRAGRDGSESYCDLIFSDDNPSVTDEWLAGAQNVTGLSGDISTLRYFHDLNFPGVEQDQRILSILIRLVFKKLRDELSQEVSIFHKDTELLLHKNGKKINMDDLGRFIGYLSILGLVEDYTVSGMNQNTVYSLQVPEKLLGHIEKSQTDAARQHTIDSLHEYYCRYKSVDAIEHEKELRLLAERNTDGSISIAACNHLIDFIYNTIAYQRRKSIGTMVEYCRSASKEPEKARQIIRNYFDRSKFSDRLEQLRDLKPSLREALKIFRTVQNYEDSEQLFWETRRLLDEVYRPDWSFLSVGAELYSGRESMESGVKKLIHCLKQDPELACDQAGAVIEAVIWIAEETKRRHFKAEAFISRLVKEAYDLEAMRYFCLNAIESVELSANEKLKKDISDKIFKLQMERLLYVAKREA